MNQVKKIKDNYYEYIYKYYSYVARWRPYNYRKIKVVIYVNVASWLVYIFMKLKIKPNTVTLAYVILGILGGILLAMPQDSFILAAAAIFYLRPFLDWADGPLARETGQTSITGDILDSYGAYLGWFAIWVGMGIYLGRTVNHAFYIISPILMFFFSADIYSVARERFIYHHLNKKEQEKIKVSDVSSVIKGSDREIKTSKIKRIKNLVDAFFEHNARTVDLICLILVIEVIFRVRILWIYYLSFFFWQGLLFSMRLALLYKGGWAESELKKLKDIVYDRNQE